MILAGVALLEQNPEPTETEIRDGDPVNVNIVVSGSGNLDTLNVPKPLDADGWKLYPATSVQPGDRRDIPGRADLADLAQDPLPPGSARNTASTGVCSPVTSALVVLAMPITAMSSPCCAGVIPLAFAAAVCECTQ